MDYPKDYMSFSQLQGWFICPAQWYFKYAERLPAPVESQVLLGGAVDDGLSFNFAEKIESHEDIPVADVLGFYEHSYKDRMEKEETVFKESETPGSVMDEGVGLIGVYYDEFVPDIQPIAVQREQTAVFTIHHEESEDEQVKLLVYPDIVTKDRLIEMKTSKTTPYGLSEPRRWQLTLQNMTRPDNDECKNPLLVCDTMVRLKKPKAVRHTMEASAEVEQYLGRLMAMVRRAVERDVIIPNRTSWACKPGPGGCWYWGVCHERF